MDAQDLEDACREALELGRSAADTGEVARYIPELGRADPAWVALAVETVDGTRIAVGDTDVRFTLQSTSKVFSLAALLAQGDPELFDCVGREPSGDAFHSIVRLEEERGRPRNPFINAGAIVVSDRLAGADPERCVAGLRRWLRAAGGDGVATFAMDEAVYASECETGYRNRALAHYMRHHGTVRDPERAVDAYFRQCSLTADVSELARVATFLANGGVDPVTGRRILGEDDTRTVVALMTTCGLYDEVGRFAVDVGVPAKSGVSGAIVAVVPGHLAVACYGPALGPRGNSVAGVAMLRHLAGTLRLSLFDGASRP